MDGFEVLPMDKAAAVGDIFCTATGDKHVIRQEHIEQMKDGAILANTGHFNVEIDIPALRTLASETREARAFVDEFTMATAGGSTSRRGPADQPRRSGGTSGARDGHVLREPGAVGRVRDPAARSSSGACIRCRRRSTRRSLA